MAKKRTSMSTKLAKVITRFVNTNIEIGKKLPMTAKKRR